MRSKHANPIRTRFDAQLSAKKSEAARESSSPGPLGGELLGVDQLAERARVLARAQTIEAPSASGRRPPLLTRLDQTRVLLADAAARLREASARNIDISPAGAWLLDNYHVVQEHIREVRESLPSGYYRELPQLSSGPLDGHPRVYELATTLVSHTEARVDLDNVNLFIQAFQSEQPLSIGELWAIPAMLRLALIESVRRMSLRTVERLVEIEDADRRGAEIMGAAESEFDELDSALRKFESNPPRLTSTFVTHLLLLLREGRGQHPKLFTLEKWLKTEGLRAERAAAQSAHRVAITQVMMANSIMSLRAVGRLDWKVFVETQSVLDRVLRADPAQLYTRMTFVTRDHYRRVVEGIARRTSGSEPAVAQHAIRLAAREGLPAYAQHVGYYLIDDGLCEMEAATGFKPSVRQRIHRALLSHPGFVFGSGIVGTTALLLALTLRFGPALPATGFIMAAALLLLPALNVAIDLVNQLLSIALPPRLLPKMDLRSTGIPAELRTAVVIPTLFADVEAVTEALETIEAQYLANRETNLHFAVLSDFTDASTQSCTGDVQIVAAAVRGIKELNTRYAPQTQDAFFLFHRPRMWNEGEGVWMGWERKRGKLAQFNRYLRTGDRAAFSNITGAAETLTSVRYVITLDADTVLPPDAATLLIGAISHPLNRAVYNDVQGRIERGFGILQPRVAVSLPSAFQSRFAAIHSGHPGVDPYTTAVSDVYQDLFGEGSFTGKGIYDVDVFEQSTRGRFPENTLLSHDLIEGSYARAGLVSDINLYDDYPSHYLTYTRRKHRWIRGDWQLLKWLTRTVPGPDGPERNRLSLLSRWKIFDNLRRSTVEIGQVALLVGGWTILPGSPLLWTGIAIAAIAAPWIVSLLLALLRPPFDKSWRAYYSAVGRDAQTSMQQVAIALAFLPHQACISADAIARALWRGFVTRRHMLEWQTASSTERLYSTGAPSTLRVMSSGIALATAAALLAVVAAVMSDGLTLQFFLAVFPVIGLWLCAPLLVDALAAAPSVRSRELPQKARAQALRYALLHWRYFDRFVGPQTNGLVPDNHQEDPAPVTALRTSPTNIGLQLLSIVSAYDLGFITVESMAARLEQVFVAFDRMDRFRGHFYNWYDLTELRVLEPRYISTVDSGNLAGHFIALRQALIAIRDQPAMPRSWEALDAGLQLASARLDTLAAAGTSATGNPQAWQAVRSAGAQVLRARNALEDAARSTSPTASLASITAPLHAAQQSLSATSDSPDLQAASREWIDWSLDFISARTDGPNAVGELLQALADRAHAYVAGMDFSFLYDARRKLFAIGYHPDSHSHDASYYDLLASEARLASFIAIAKNDAPVEHWFHLGRTLTRSTGATALVSWSGSMFEYLMPALVMQSWPLTLLDQTYHGAVQRHIEHGRSRGVPWGESESAYAVRDRHATYQYRAFGVADLGLKNGLDRDLVIAPYASALALTVEPARAAENMAVLERKGALGAFGFYDALDYTRAAPGQRFALVRNYMAHHVGMSLVAFTNSLLLDIWPRRFHTEPIVRAAELLLHERIPRRLALQAVNVSSAPEVMPDRIADTPTVREFERPDSNQLHIALLGQTPYMIMVSQSGAGYSRFEDLAVTRWRSDATVDNMGQFCYVRDVTRAHVWSAAHQPVCAPADSYRAMFATDRVTFNRVDGDIETRTEITIVPADSAEVRRVTVTNNGPETRELELTSYGEIVLAPPEAERAHPAFANLFVETQFHEWCNAITATRRPRSAGERSLVCVHVVATGAKRVGSVTCETDRSRFLGRGRTTRAPQALDSDGDLCGTTGSVLDPIFALRARVRLKAGESASVAFTTLVATSRERAFELADRYQSLPAAQRALDLASTTAQVELGDLNISSADAAAFQELAGHLLYSSEGLGPTQNEQWASVASQPLLWSIGVSGDLPILLTTIDSDEGIPTLRQLFAAHHYWRRRGLRIDMVVLNEQASTYLHELDDKIASTLAASTDAGVMDKPGGVFLRRRDVIGDEVLALIRATARVQVRCDGTSIAAILDSISVPAAAPAIAALRIAAPVIHEPQSTVYQPAGLTDNDDYHIRVSEEAVPPAPWSNVIANPFGGFLVTERGAGYTWAGSSYFYRLTPWHNDPVSDPPGDAIYLQDEDSGNLWSPTPAPAGSGRIYSVMHRAGSTSFDHEFGGIRSSLVMGMADNEAVRISTLTLTNTGHSPRAIRFTAYVEWTLGALREQTRQHIRTSCTPEESAIYANNPFDAEFAKWTSFCALSEPLTSYTTSRREFLGRNGTLAAPAALRGAALSNVCGVGFDPCAALQCSISIAPGESRSVVVILGAAPTELEASQAVLRFRGTAGAGQALQDSVATWQDRLSVITVSTPDRAFDAIINKWSLYQAMSSRMWARTGFYQSSGAYGFRDQLQDVMAFVYAEPGVARAHILRAAARQFVEGDVQHWWHPHTGRGVRTRFSDDLAWLPHVVDHYIRTTGDDAVLDEQIPFITMRTLEPHEHEIYDLPAITSETATLYEHCARALRKACTRGERGLPLIGAGDWNDGMNRVGVGGKGESVWLAWFLTDTLRSFALIADSRGDAATATAFRNDADLYVQVVEETSWDGAWYRRAYFDDGTPIGSAQNDECRIDAIAQSWSVISGAAAPERQQQAMASLEAHLVDDEARIIGLLTPPFNKTDKDPGYIKGYLPGVRENGAQYTHAALWTVLATLRLGKHDRAFELFQMINPLARTATEQDIATYKVEPYVVAADVYTANGQLGRGGWTWYTGSASWLYRIGLESILGFRKHGASLVITPGAPSHWPEYGIRYRYGRSTYEILVKTAGAPTLTVNGVSRTDGVIPLVDDGNTHTVLITRV